MRGSYTTNSLQVEVKLLRDEGFGRTVRELEIFATEPASPSDADSEVDSDEPEPEPCPQQLNRTLLIFLHHCQALQKVTIAGFPPLLTHDLFLLVGKLRADLTQLDYAETDDEEPHAYLIIRAITRQPHEARGAECPSSDFGGGLVVVGGGGGGANPSALPTPIPRPRSHLSCRFTPLPPALLKHPRDP